MIVAAAIRQGQLLWTGKRHGLLIPEVFRQTGQKVLSHQQGFVLDTGEFVTREEASRIALDTGQVATLRYPNELFSEELW